MFGLLTHLQAQLTDLHFMCEEQIQLNQINSINFSTAMYGQNTGRTKKPYTNENIAFSVSPTWDLPNP